MIKPEKVMSVLLLIRSLYYEAVLKPTFSRKFTLAVVTPDPSSICLIYNDAFTRF